MDFFLGGGQACDMILTKLLCGKPQLFHDETSTVVHCITSSPPPPPKKREMNDSLLLSDCIVSFLGFGEESAVMLPISGTALV